MGNTFQGLECFGAVVVVGFFILTFNNWESFHELVNVVELDAVEVEVDA